VIKISFVYLFYLILNNVIIILGQYRNKSNEQQLSNDFDEQTDGFFSFSSPHTQSRRSYSRERSSNSFAKVRKISNEESLFSNKFINLEF